LLGAISRYTPRTGARTSGNARLRLNYAEDERRKLEAGIQRKVTLSEQPHYTTAVLDAEEVYHTGGRAGRKLHSGAETPTQRAGEAFVADDFAGVDKED
jgi:hypothetical protein